MTTEAKPNNKKIIIGICIAALVIAVVAVAIFFATKGNVPLNDAYFVSDSTKYVLTVDGDTLDADYIAEQNPVKTHVVYTYSGDDITGVTSYLEYADEATAKSALATYKDADQTGIKSISTNGKYLVVVMTEDQYSDLKASDVKEQIEFMEMLKNLDLGDDTTPEETNAATEPK